ncbi:DUF4381 domain-containing protein [Marinagarivorans cellulosilyticus]|uniref:DUF4381 domain-containing protein n=1 Tax=Marinagarivorans cellulosilyticus TaxID=2721545 RepID=A0AAN1WJ78_9GAMM|nr:DUF4381 domain-containing protein [Marinagarivorans cellulosilyticus]BCD98572.1 hypothetical protein MARGE09_P2773 [Marinagarivorans cellulosilyticus]
MTTAAPQSMPQPTGSSLDPQMQAQIKAQMVDIIEPSAIGIWPLAWGWWALIALAIAGISVTTVLIIQRQKRNRYRRQALKTLQDQRFDNALSQSQFLMRLSKQVALAAYPQERQHIASLSGERWLQWLNGKTAAPLFNTASAKQWQACLYAPGTQQAPDNALTIALKAWIKNHRAQPKGGAAHV